MRRLPQNISLLAVSVVTVTAFGVAPVFAESSGTVTTDDNVSNTTVTNTSSDSNFKRTTPVRADSTIASRAPEPNGVEQNDSGHEETLKQKAEQLLAEKRQNEKTDKSVADRQKACDAHQAEITTRTQNYAEAAQKHLDTFTSIYNKVLAFQDTHKLSLSNFDQLKADADAKQAAAQSAVAALSSSDVKVDCTSQDPATAVAALKTAVASARQALLDYRTAIKNLVVALENAKPSDNSNTSTGSNQ